MKKIILLLLAVALFAACSKKQDAEVKPPLTPKNATAKDLAGKWSVTADTTYTYFNGQNIPAINTTFIGQIFQFNADGSTGAVIAGSNTVPFTFKVSGGVIVLEVGATQNNAATELSVTITEI